MPAQSRCILQLLSVQVHRDRLRQQPGQRRVVEPGRQHVLPV